MGCSASLSGAASRLATTSVCSDDIDYLFSDLRTDSRTELCTTNSPGARRFAQTSVSAMLRGLLNSRLRQPPGDHDRSGCTQTHDRCTKQCERKEIHLKLRMIE
jgi:hypothetical protein